MSDDLKLLKVVALLSECLFKDRDHSLPAHDRDGICIFASHDNQTFVYSEFFCALLLRKGIRQLCRLLPLLLFHVVEYLDHLQPCDGWADLTSSENVEQVFFARQIEHCVVKYF